MLQMGHFIGICGCLSDAAVCWDSYSHHNWGLLLLVIHNKSSQQLLISLSQLASYIMLLYG